MRRVLILMALATAGAAGGLAWAGPAAAGGGGGCHEITEGSGGAVDLVEFCFSPSVLRVAAGTAVTWTNQDPVDHEVAGTGWRLEGPLVAGASGTHRFDDPGVYPYTCYLHPGMNGVVMVADGEAAGAATVRDDAPATPVESVAVVVGGDGDGTPPLVAGAAGAGAGLAAGLVGARRWPRRRSA